MSNSNEDIEKEYGLKTPRKGVRGKYFEEYQKATLSSAAYAGHFKA